MQMAINTDEGHKPLRSIASALLPEDRAIIERRALEIQARLECTRPMRDAEVFPDVAPHWHVVTALPGQERTATDELSDRGFGVYLPESEHTEIRRGRKVDLKRLMLPGYVFVFVWDVDRHIDRIRACDGVRGLLFINGYVAIVQDCLINDLRKAENAERPLKGMVEVVHKKKRWRQSHKTMKQVDLDDTRIMAVHSYSPIIEEMRSDSETERLSAFHKALGLAA